MVQIRHIHSETPSLSAKWQALTSDERFARIKELLQDYRDCFDLICLQGSEIILSSNALFDIGMKGIYIRQIEQRIREILGEPLEIYLETRNDENKPRDPDQRKRILAWIEMRAAMKKQAAAIDDLS